LLLGPVLKAKAQNISVSWEKQSVSKLVIKSLWWEWRTLLLMWIKKVCWQFS